MKRLVTPIWLSVSLFAACAFPEQIPVRFPQGSAHGFLVVKTQAGKRIAGGDVTQVVKGNKVTSGMSLHFLDGSIHQETTVFSQDKFFRLISDHRIQRGPSFPSQIDVSIDAVTGQVASRGKDGKISREHMDLPPDLANGLPPNLLLNISPERAETKLPFIAPGFKPRLVHVSVKPSGERPFMIGGLKKKAMDYVLHVEIGGLSGVIAPMIGKQPDDYHIWILTGESPAFIREEGQLYEGGPIWRIEQVSPTFP